MLDEYSRLAMDDTEAYRLDSNEDEHPIRSKYQRDKDRILYSKAFRRLSGKTQVFLAGNDDHARTRLTHTLEVAQISRTIAKSLGLNEELTEAIALGHDIGHTPFGHVGERMLNRIMNGCYEIGDFNNEYEVLNNMKGFKHNWQSIRVATELEPSMNLTDYTLWGILNHSEIENGGCEVKGEDQSCLLRHETDRKCSINLEGKESLSFYKNMKVKYICVYDRIAEKWSFEGLIVQLADEIAQRHHDIEDALEYNIIYEDELCDKLKEIFTFDKYMQIIKQEDEINNMEEFSKSIEEHKKNLHDVEDSISKGNVDVYKSKFSKFIVNLLTTDVILNTKNKLNKIIDEYKIKDKCDFYSKKTKIKNYKSVVSFSNFISEQDKQLKSFLKNRILNSHKAQTMDGVGQYIIRELFKAYIINPQQLPDKTIIKLFENLYKENEDELNKYKYLDKNSEKYLDKYNVGELRNKLSEYHYNRKSENNVNNDDIDYKKYKSQLLRTVCDYISGMTDKYTIEQHRKLYNIINY